MWRERREGWGRKRGGGKLKETRVQKGKSVHEGGEKDRRVDNWKEGKGKGGRGRIERERVSALAKYLKK